MTTDPRIEAAAIALYGDVNKSHANEKGWDEVLPRWQESYRSNARAALAAADKAATITTVEGLDALPSRSIVQGHDGFRHEKRTEGWLLIVNHEVSDHHANEIELPARVIHWGQS